MPGVDRVKSNMKRRCRLSKMESCAWFFKIARPGFCRHVVYARAFALSLGAINFLFNFFITEGLTSNATNKTQRRPGAG